MAERYKLQSTLCPRRESFFEHVAEVLLVALIGESLTLAPLAASYRDGVALGALAVSVICGLAAWKRIWEPTQNVCVLAGGFEVYPGEIEVNQPTGHERSCLRSAGGEAR